MRADATTPLEKELLAALAFLLEQVEEDVPLDIRSKHLKNAIEDAMCILFPTEEEAKA
tara:strand:- start:1929 stop:2102 length:174 start_codon:yes stop_codon:yes gene_type:complete